MSGWRHKGAMQERLDEMRDQAPTTTACAFCPWRFTGTALEGREASLEHRRAEHPGYVVYVKPKRRRRVEQTASDREIVQTMAGRSRSLRTVRRRGLSDTQVAEAARRYEDGESVRSVAASFFETWGYASTESLAVALYRRLPDKVVHWRGKAWAGGRNGSAGVRISAERGAALEMLYGAKWSLKQIAVLVHERWGFPSVEVCRNELSRYLRDQGVEIRSKGALGELPEMGRDAAAAMVARADGEDATREPVWRGTRETELAFRAERVEAV